MNLNHHSLIKNGKTSALKLPFSNFNQFLQNQAETLKTKPALIFEDFLTQTTTTISYQELDSLTQSLASRFLKSYQLPATSYISFAFANTPEIILLNYAAWRANLITVPLDTKRDTLERKIYKLNLTHTKILFTRSDPTTQKENYQIKKALPKLKIVETKNFSHFKKMAINNQSNTIRHHPSAIRQSLDADCLILFTSGTTALPKGVRLTLNSLFANATSIADWLNFNSKDNFHILLPLHHINSTTFVNTTLLTGGTVVLSPRYSKSNFWPTMAKHSCTGASIVPTIAYDLLSETTSFKKHQSKLKKVRRIQLGSAPVQPKVVEEFIKKFNIPLYQGYGQTETSLRSTGVPMDLNPKQFAHIRSLNSLGTELKYTNVTILTSQGKQCVEDQIGEICIRGPIIMNGYLNNPSATKEAFESNWFHSGDTGYFKKIYGREFFFLKGRTKEIIKKGGVLISPLAIENTLLKNYPQLDKVYVVGFPDARLGQEIGFVAISAKGRSSSGRKKSTVVNKILKDAQENHLKNLSPFEFPQAGIIVNEVKLPKTSTGKIQRIKIREKFGPLLLKQFRTIYQNKTHSFRLIGPDETTILKQALKINNLRWGKNLSTNFKEFTARAQNGLLIGAFDKKGHLLGTVSALHLNQSDLDKPRAQTWDGITDNGTLSTHNHQGNTLLCIAISTAPQKGVPLREKQSVSVQKLSTSNLKDYLASDKDPVIRFHRRPKAGLKSGAKITKIIKNGRPHDKDTLGYNLLMKYPINPSKLQRSGANKNTPTINSQASIGTQLIEVALLYAHNHKLKHIYVYTRPATLSKYFK